jgi:hypothetical protein
MEIRPRPDRGLRGIAVALACSATVSVLLADIPGFWKALAATAIAISAFDSIHRRMSIRGSHYVARAVLQADGQWMLCCGGTDPIGARLSHAWGVTSGPVIALEWQCDDGRRRQVWLLRRDLPRPVWRRLRVRLGLA